MSGVVESFAALNKVEQRKPHEINSPSNPGIKIRELPDAPDPQYPARVGQAPPQSAPHDRRWVVTHTHDGLRVDSRVAGVHRGVGAWTARRPAIIHCQI